MPRVIRIDLGTVSIDLCGLEDGRLCLDRSIPTAEALADPARFVGLLEEAGPLDLVTGPSGYGLPLTRARDATDGDLRLALLAPPGERGGIAGLSALLRMLARSSLPVVLTPGVLHLPTVPPHRKVNRVDMGTADKVCAVALAVDDQARRLGCPLSATSFVLLELGGAFTAAGAVAGGRVEAVSGAIRRRLEPFAPTRVLEGFAAVAKQAAQGAALVADGLAGGAHRELVELLAIREARGSVLDHLYVVPREQALRRLGGGAELS